MNEFSFKAELVVTKHRYDDARFDVICNNGYGEEAQLKVAGWIYSLSSDGVVGGRIRG